MINEVIKAVNDSELDVKFVNVSVECILNAVKKAHVIIKKSKTDKTIEFKNKMREINGFLDKHHQITKEIAENSPTSNIM